MTKLHKLNNNKYEFLGKIFGNSFYLTKKLIIYTEGFIFDCISFSSYHFKSSPIYFFSCYFLAVVLPILAVLSGVRSSGIGIGIAGNGLGWAGHGSSIVSSAAAAHAPLAVNTINPWALSPVGPSGVVTGAGAAGPSGVVNGAGASGPSGIVTGRGAVGPTGSNGNGVRNFTFYIKYWLRDV